MFCSVVAKNATRGVASEESDRNLPTSVAARFMRARTVWPHVSVTAPQPATIAAPTIKAGPRRTKAKNAIETIHKAGYQTGQPPAALQNGSASIAAPHAMSGANHHRNPRRDPIATCPALAPATSTAAPESAIASCQPIHNLVDAPVGRRTIPRARSRNTNGPAPANASTNTSATRREYKSLGDRSTRNKPLRHKEAVKINAATFAVNRLPIAV